MRKRPSSNALASGAVSQRAEKTLRTQHSGNEASSSKAEELASGAASQRVEQSGTVSQRAESTKNADDIMDEIRSLGYYPPEHGTTRALAEKRRRAEKAGLFSASQLEELRMMKTQKNEKSLRDQGVHIMEAIRALGYIPKYHSEHDLLAQQYKGGLKSGKLTSEEIAEAEALTAAHAASLAQRMDPPPEACAPPDPLDAFAEEAENRLEQDLLMANSGMRTYKVMRRIKRYRKYFDEPALQDNALVLQYRQQMDQASQTFTGCSCYVPGDTIEGDALRSFASEPVISGPIVCQLCDDASFLYDDDFAKHQRNEHCGVNEYRKRALFLQEQRGPHAITGEEKRIIVQNFAHFQQFSRPGAKSNTFARIPEVPRCEAACALCARKDFNEHRHMLNLFAQPPEDQQRGQLHSRSASQSALIGHEGPEQEEEEAEDDAHGEEEKGSWGGRQQIETVHQAQNGLLLTKSRSLLSVD